MFVVNNGRACSISNYGLPNERLNPASSGTITKPPANGTAAFSGHKAAYSPNAGYYGDDYFEYEATAQGTAQNIVTLRVRVKVTVRSDKGAA
jgi:hypothetical protein